MKPYRTKAAALRLFILASGITVALIGVHLLLPWMRGTATYVSPKQAFYGAIFYVGWGGFAIACATVGWRGFGRRFRRFFRTKERPDHPGRDWTLPRTKGRAAAQPE